MYRRKTTPQQTQQPGQPSMYNYGATAPQQMQQATPAVHGGYTGQHAQSPTNANTFAPGASARVPASATNTQANAHPTSNANPSAADFISNKISKINAKNKVMDFSDALVKAKQQDYANIHGIGGKDHAPNSGIGLTLCDYSRGKGENSITVRYNIDVRDIDRLLCVVQAALTKTLGLTEQMKAVREFATANGILIGWLQSNHQPSLQEIAGIQQTLCNGLMAQDPDNTNDRVLWHWEVQKNNPYSSACTWRDNVEYTPVTTVNFMYNPSKNYAWTIKVANYLAPINRQQNGASSHNNKGAIEKKEVMFPVTTEDLYYALCDVSHYITLWENRMFRTIDAMCNEKERRAEAKRQQRN